VIGEDGETGESEIGFDGFSECWFRDETQFRYAVESDMTQMWGAGLTENVVVPPPLVRT
jgi:hypothetical protein